MKAKKYLALLLTLATVFSLSACGGPEKQPAEGKDDGDSTVYSITFAHHQTADSPIGAGIEALAKTLNEKSNGRLDVKTYPASQLGDESSIFEQMEQGSVQMSTFGFGIIGSKSPSALAMEIGYMFDDYDHLMSFLGSDVFAEMQQNAIDACGIRIVGGYYNGTRHVTTNKNPATNPEELKGNILRVPNSEMIIKTIEAMGADATVVAFSETYMACQNGAVDGQENPIPSIVSMNFQEVQKYLLKTGHMVQAATICINEKFLQSLPEDLRELILTETQNTLNAVSQDNLGKEESQLSILTDADMEIVEVDREAFKTACQPLIEEYESVWGEGLYDRIQAAK